jgi:hypothetical protein
MQNCRGQLSKLPLIKTTKLRRVFKIKSIKSIGSTQKLAERISISKNNEGFLASLMRILGSKEKIRFS